MSRRRIYDVANVLESLGVIFRKRKNLYMWMGFGTLGNLVTDIRKGKRRSSMKQWSRSDPGKKYASASFAILSQSFVDLLITSQGEGPVSLESAADRLVDLPSDHPSYQQVVKSKTRRLYDVANVLISLELIQKCETMGRRPAYFWIFRP